MAIQARLADGRVLNFPDGTDQEVINRTVRSLIAPPATKAKAESVGLPAGEDLTSLITPAEDQPQAERKVYTGSVFDTQPFEPKFNPEEAARLSRRDYAERVAQQPRRTQSMRATPSEQIERTVGQAIADTGIGLLQGAAGIPKGIAANINAGDNPVAKFYEEAIQAGERSKSPYLQSQKAEREALLKNVLQNQGELAQTRAAFTSMFSPAGADVVSQGAGSMLPTLGMSLLSLGQKSFVAMNALANAGDAAQSTAQELSQMSPQDWSKSDAYQDLRGKGLSHKDAVRMLAPLMAMPSQLVGGFVGGVSGATGLEKTLAGKGITGGVRERAARAGAELLGEEAETLAPSLAGNITQRLIDEKKSLTEGLGREAVETAFGATPGMALAATGRSAPEAPKEMDTRGLAERMARERGFLTPEARAERPSREAPLPTQERVEPTFDPEKALVEPTTPTKLPQKIKELSDLDDLITQLRQPTTEPTFAEPEVGGDLVQQREQERADVLAPEGEAKAPGRFSYMDEAAKYDTPEMRLKQAEALDGDDVTGLIFGEAESYGRAALKKKSLTSGYAEKMDNRNDAADAATVAFGTGDYNVFTPYEKLFPKTAAKLKAALIPRQEAPTPPYEQPEVEAPADLGTPFSLAEEMEGVRAPLTSDIEGEIERLTKDQQEALAQRKNLEKRTAGTSLFQTLRGTLKDNELSELGGPARMVGKNQFLSLKAPRDKAGSSMENMVNSGKLDQFLPYNMRPGHPDYDNGESAEHIREKLRNNQFYTYETELDIRQLDQDIESIERQIEELLSDDDINKELQYAANEQREIDQATQEPAAPVADRAAEQREGKASDDELDKREAQLDREAELNQREARLLEERKRLEEERLKLESPTKEDVAQQEERKAKAAEADEREQIRKESEAGAGQFELTREEGRQDTTGGLFEQPAEAPKAETKAPQVDEKEERKKALAQFKKSLLTAIPPFRSRGGDNRVAVLKPTPLSGPLMMEVVRLANDAVDLGLPLATLGNIKSAGSTRAKAIAMVSNNGWLMLGSQWKTTSAAEKLLAVIHEIGHVVDAEGNDISEKSKWDAAHNELKDWYRRSADKIRHPLAYPFASQYKGKVRIKAESFAQSFGYYFTSPVDLQKNAPEAYSQIQSIVEGIQDESQRARAAGATTTGIAGVKVQPTRATEGAKVQPEAGAKRAGVSTAPRLEDRGAGEVTEGDDAQDINAIQAEPPTKEKIKQLGDTWLLGRDKAGNVGFGPGAKAYSAVANIANTVLDKIAMKPVSPELGRAMRNMKARVDQVQNKIGEVAVEMNKLSKDEREMISDIIEGELKADVHPPQHILNLAASIQSLMSRQSEELVELGMLSKEAANRWDNKYLPRFYETKLRDEVNGWAKATRDLFKKQPMMRGIKGSQLRARGLFEVIDANDLQTYIDLGWEQRDPEFNPKTSEATIVWRDYDRAERENMGEIRDAMFRFVMGYNASQRDIALGRLYKDLAENYASQFPLEGYVQVPETKAEGTQTPRYGKLEGLYVPKEVMDHLSANDESMASGILKLYRAGLSKWKEGKTVLNPVSHANNVISNVTMAHFSGVSYWDAHKYAGAIKDFVTNSDMIKEAKDIGVFGGSFNNSELVKSMPPELKAMANMTESRLANFGERIWDTLAFTIETKGKKYGARPVMQWAYEGEDMFFRYLIYRDARQRGMEPEDARDYSQEYIFTYDDLPKGARALRDYGMPFFSYTYKVVPVLARTALVYPWRYAAPATIAYTANALMYAIAANMGGNDDDWWTTTLYKYMTDDDFRKKAKAIEAEERKLLPEWMKGQSAILSTPKAIRMGMDEATNLPMFLDISRIFPGGDLLDANNNSGGVALLQPLTPSNPVLTSLVAMLANKDMFLGKDVVKKTDTDEERAQKRAAWLWKQTTPAIAVGNYHFDRAMNTIANMTQKPITVDAGPMGVVSYTGVGKDGLPVQPKHAMLQTMGIKIRPYDLELSRNIEESNKKQALREIDFEINRINRQEGKNVISAEAAEIEREKLLKKKGFIAQGLTPGGKEK